jgi:aspartyl-tRNA(Asn)/glutamyl-tRNA(Gln) amidotransferase subunit B
MGWVSEAATSINSPPNTHVALFDLAVPGSQPVFQIATLLPALRAAIALNCSIQLESKFDRKHYFYHDQPAGYQITQYYEPFALDGKVKLSRDDGLGADDGDEVTIGIKQIQMEQDTAKSHEQDEETTLIDFNRAGQPLIEIVSLPHLHSPEAAAAYVRKVQAILFAVDAVTTGMEMGGLRADVNVSVRRRDDAEPGTHKYSGITGLGQRTEIKNLSTLKGVEDAIRAERDRQIAVLEGGGTIEGETRGWSLTRPNETRLLRGKEGEVDYRYMPDPDIPPLYISQGVVDHLKKTLPKLPDELFAMLTDPAQYDLSPTDARILLSIDDGARLDYFQDVVGHLEWTSGSRSKRPLYGKTAGNWVLQELGSLISTGEMDWTDHKVSAEVLAQLANQLHQKNITGSTAKQILKMLFEGDERRVDEIVSQEGLAFRPLCEEEYEVLARTVMSEHGDVVQQIREKGRTGKMMFLVGQMMRRGEGGRVEAQRAERVLRGLVMEESAGPQKMYIDNIKSGP